MNQNNIQLNKGYKYCKIDNKGCIPSNENSVTNYKACNFKYGYERKNAKCKKRRLVCYEFDDFCVND